MKVCVYGAGAIGGHVAGHLARAGRCEVAVVARGEALAAIRERGLRVVTPGGAFVTPVRAVADAAELGQQDYVLIAVKAHQVPAALDGLAGVIGPQTVIIPPTTGIPYYFFHGLEGPYRGRRLPGIDPGDRQWRAMPPAQVLGGVIWIGAHSIGPGAVQQDGARAGLPIGELDGRPSARAQAFSGLLTQSGIPAPVRANIRGEIWMKFANSLCWNPVAVLTLARMGQMEEAPGVVATVTRMMEEIDAVAHALGLELPQPPARRIATTLGAAAHKMSMLQDLEHGRPLELDPLIRSLRAVQAITDLATPVLDAVLALVGLRAAIAAF